MNTIDYSTPTPRTDQECFDLVARHLLAQGKRAEKFGKCAYRGDDGTKCAIGALIPDEVYRAEWDPTSTDVGLPAKDLYMISAAVPYLPRNADLARALQCIHDYGSPPEEWRDRLRYVAKTFGLDEGVLDEWDE